MTRIKPADLPSPPETALKVLQACANENINFGSISELVTNDPQLTAEVLAVVNSAFYGYKEAVTSISQAIAIIGIDSLHHLSLCLSLKDLVKNDQIKAEMLNEFWSDSLYRAYIAQHLAKHFKVDACDNFTRGLLQDFGLLILFYLQPEHLSHWSRLRKLSPTDRILEEQLLFDETHVSAFVELAGTWNLPESIIQPISQHHYSIDEFNQKNIAAQIIKAADLCAWILSAEDSQQASEACHQYLQHTLHLSIEDIELCFNQTAELVEETAASMGISVDVNYDYQQILQLSNKRLAEDNLFIQELNWQLQKTIEERDKLAATLDDELRLAAEVQASLLPKDTELPIHGFNIPASFLSGDFYDYLELKDGSILFCLADVSGKGTNASLLMVKVSSLFHCMGKYVDDLAELVTMVNKELVETTIRGMFVTFICGKYNPKTGALEVVNAGHPPGIILGDQTGSQAPIKINSLSIPLGIDADTIFVKENYTLDNAVLYMFTDGIFESTINGTMMGVDALVRYLSALQVLTVQEQLGFIKTRLTSEQMDTFDDMTILAVDGRGQ